MNRVLLQFWEESERGWGVRPDGASFHLDMSAYQDYIKKIYDGRDENNIPDEYDRIVGSTVEALVSDDIYDLLITEKNLRLSQYQLNNLIKLKEVVTNAD